MSELPTVYGAGGLDYIVRADGERMRVTITDKGNGHRHWTFSGPVFGSTTTTSVADLVRELQKAAKPEAIAISPFVKRAYEDYKLEQQAILPKAVPLSKVGDTLKRWGSKA